MTEVNINEGKKTKEYNVEGKTHVQIKNRIVGTEFNMYGKQGSLHCQLFVGNELVKDMNVNIIWSVNGKVVQDTMEGVNKDGYNLNSPYYNKHIGFIIGSNTIKTVVEGFEYKGEYIEGSEITTDFELKYSTDSVIDFNIYDKEDNLIEELKEGDIINIKGTVKYKDPYTSELKPLYDIILGFATKVYVNSDSIPNTKKVWTNILSKDGFQTGNIEVKKEYGFTFDGIPDKITCQFEKTKTDMEL